MMEYSMPAAFHYKLWQRVGLPSRGSLLRFIEIITITQVSHHGGQFSNEHKNGYLGGRCRASSF